MFCKVLHYNTKNMSEVSSARLWCKQKHLRGCVVLIEQSSRPCQTGSRFPGDHWTVPFFFSALFSLLMVSHLFFFFSSCQWGLVRLPGSPAFSDCVNSSQPALPLALSQFHSGWFHCSQSLARRPGNQQVHQQVCLAGDKAYWLTAALPRSSKLAVWTWQCL